MERWKAAIIPHLPSSAVTEDGRFIIHDIGPSRSNKDQIPERSQLGLKIGSYHIKKHYSWVTISSYASVMGAYPLVKVWAAPDGRESERWKQKKAFPSREYTMNQTTIFSPTSPLRTFSIEEAWYKPDLTASNMSRHLAYVPPLPRSCPPSLFRFRWQKIVGGYRSWGILLARSHPRVYGPRDILFHFASLIPEIEYSGMKGDSSFPLAHLHCSPRTFVSSVLERWDARRNLCVIKNQSRDGKLRCFETTMMTLMANSSHSIHNH